MSGFDSKRQASKELLKQALDALLCCSPDTEVGAALQIKTVKSLRAELAQPEAEPVAWQWLNSAVYRKKLPKFAEAGAWNPLYAAPQAQPDHIEDMRDMVPAQAVAEPLTDGEIT